MFWHVRRKVEVAVKSTLCERPSGAVPSDTSARTAVLPGAQAGRNGGMADKRDPGAVKTLSVGGGGGGPLTVCAGRGTTTTVLWYNVVTVGRPLTGAEMSLSDEFMRYFASVYQDRIRLWLRQWHRCVRHGVPYIRPDEIST